MAIALIAHSSGASANASDATTSPAIDTTGANLIVLGVGCVNTGLAVHDSKSNSWTPLTMYGGSGFSRAVQMWYSIPTSVGSGHTFTADTAFFEAIFVAAFSGAAASPFDQESGGIGVSQPGSITPSEDDELLITTIGDSDSTGRTIDQSFTLTDEVASAANNVGGAMAYLIETAAAAKNPTWNPASSGRVAMAAFKAAAGGGSTVNITAANIGTHRVGMQGSAVSRLLNPNRILSNNLGERDATARKLSPNRILSNNLGLRDTVARLLSPNRTLSNNLGMRDVTARLLNPSRTVANNLGLRDAVARLLNPLRKVTNNLGITDFVRFPSVLIKLINASDNLGLRQGTVSRLLNPLRSLSNNFGLRDATARLLNPLRRSSDSLGLRDLTKRLLNPLRTVTNNLGITDFLIFPNVQIKLIHASDLFGLQQGNVARLLNPLRKSIDSVGLTEVVSRKLSPARSISDRMGLRDLTSRSSIWSRTVADLLGVRDLLRPFVIPPILVSGVVSLAAQFVYVRSVNPEFERVQSQETKFVQA